jgi:hypothetical protein
MPTIGRRGRFLRCAERRGRPHQPRPLQPQPGHRVAPLVMMPLLQLLVKMLHREAAIAFLIQPQHAQDLLGRRPAARRPADPPIAQPHRPLIAQPVTPAPERPLDTPASPPLPLVTARPAHAARATPRNASVLPLAALLSGPFPVPLSGGSKSGQITRYKNRTDHESATPSNSTLDGDREPLLDFTRRQSAGRVCRRHDATWREAVADRLASATKLKVQDTARSRGPSAKDSFATATPA